MSTSSAAPLLESDEPPAFERLNAAAASPLVLVCDHASARIPRRLAQLGLSAAEQRTHIALDIGAREVALGFAGLAQATIILQNYSRLVIDCNRPPASAQSIVAESDHTRIPGNQHIDAAARSERRRALFDPYHHCIAEELEQRQRSGRWTLLVAVHSFTPVFDGFQRPWHIGTLYGNDPRAARALLPILRREAGLVVGDNEPYAIGADTDFTLPVHGEARNIAHVGLEIRQDLLGGRVPQDQWSARLARAFAELVGVLQR